MAGVMSETLTKGGRGGETRVALESLNGGSPVSLRELNRGRVVEALRVAGVASRAEVSRRTGLSRSTVSSLISEMADEGLVVDHSGLGPADHASQAGRPPKMIRLGRPAGVALGIDLGKRHAAVAVADLGHTVLAEARRELEEGYDAGFGMDACAELVTEVLEEAGVCRADVIGTGLGLPGPIHRGTGQVGSTEILPGWGGLRVAEEMGRRLDLPVHVDNDANLGALAELFWGAGQGATSLVYLKVATGIGAGLVIDQRLYYGAGGTAGEIGHLTIDEKGPICRCGSRGCLETFAAAPAIVELLRSSLGHELTIDEVVERAIAGDAGCRRAIADSGRHIGHAVATMCNLFNPERVVVGGSVGLARELLLEEMRDAVRRWAIASAEEDVEIVAGVLGERAEVLGAVALVLSSSERSASPAIGVVG